MQLERIQAVLAQARKDGILGAERPAAIFHDLDEFSATVGRICAAFPPGTLHTLAVKANPLAGLLRRARAAGMGAECASLPELQHALRLGFAPSSIVFDSPAKTGPELRFAVEQGVFLNADNLQEVAHLAALARGGATLRAGIRVNPQTGAGSYAGTSTATATSKFGVPLLDEREALLDAYAANPWLVGLHVHTGSQVCPLDLVVRGVSEILKLAHEIEQRRGRPLEVIDIGGGLPANYGSDDAGAHLAEYAARLRQDVPGLFRYRVVTEFGRAVHAKAGWAASRVEYTKRSGGRRIAVIHLGADFLVRTAYVPEVWVHRVSVHAPDGAPKPGEAAVQDIAGPLCFTGDLVARERSLPLAEPGDLVVIHDTGAYALSMWSRYNSRAVPGVYGYTIAGGQVKLETLKAPETPEDVLKFWGA